MAETSQVGPVAPPDRAAAINLIVLAFAADPVTRWCWPDGHVYLTHMAGFVEAFCGSGFDHGGAHITGDRGGAALWLPPGAHPDSDRMDAIVSRTVAPERQQEIAELMTQMGTHHPEEPHWYLPMIGVDPAHQGKGYGAALLRYALDRCDRDGNIAYLESTNPRNISLYERHGFEAVARIQVASSPPVVPMVRRPR